MARQLMGDDKFYEAAREADYKFFNGLKYNNHASSFLQAVNTTEQFLARYGIKLPVMEDCVIPLSDLGFITSSKWRIHRWRDLTALADPQHFNMSLLTFSFGNEVIQLDFTNRGPNQPGNAVLSYKNSPPLSYDKIFKQDFFRSLPGHVMAQVMRKSRTSGQPITIKHLEEALLMEDPKIDLKNRSFLEICVWQLNHFMLLLDFEIARHLQLPGNNEKSQEYSDLPIAIGVAILSAFNNGQLLTDKDTIKGLFCGQPWQREEALKNLIKLYVSKKPAVEAIEVAAVEMFNQLLTDEFSKQ